MSITSSSSSSNIVQINVVEPSFSVTKYSNKSNVKVGDSFFYNIQILNSGEYPATSVILTDTLPAEFNVTSITSNGTPVVGDLSLGIDLGPLGPGDSFNVIVDVEVTADIYNENGFTNSCTTVFTTVLNPLDPPTTVTIDTVSSSSVKVFDPDLEILKTPNLLDAAVGDTITYTLYVTNTGNVDLTDIIVRDNLNPCLMFVNNSIKVDGKLLTTSSIMSGVKFKKLLPGESHTIQFDVVVMCNQSQTISNYASGQFTYVLDCGAYMGIGFETSNTTELNTVYSHVSITKQATNFTGCELTQGSVITYKIDLLNDGDVDITNFVLRDKLPSNVVLVNDSFVINGVSYNVTKGDILNGISLGPIPMGQSITVTFDVVVNVNRCCASCNTIVKNVASGIYYFDLPDGTNRYRRTDEAINQLSLCTPK